MARLRRDDAGAVSASVAVVPMVVGLFFLVIQISLWYYGRSVTTAAAEHGLDAARVYQGPGTGADAGAGRATVDEFFDQVGGVASHTVAVQQTGGRVQLTVHADPITLVPWLNPPIDVTVEAPLEELAN
jgi:hypothetical protein